MRGKKVPVRALENISCSVGHITMKTEDITHIQTSKLD